MAVNFLIMNPAKVPEQNCAYCLSELSSPNSTVVYHDKVNEKEEGILHPFHKTCVIDAAKQKKLIDCPFQCGASMNINSLFSRTELVYRRSRQLIQNIAAGSISALAAGSAAWITVVAAQTLTTEIVLQEAAKLATESKILFGIGGILGAATVRANATLSVAIFITTLSLFSLNPSATLAPAAAGSGSAILGTLAITLAELAAKIAAEKLGHDFSSIQYGVEAGACAGFILLATSFPLPVALAAMTTIAGAVSGVLQATKH